MTNARTIDKVFFMVWMFLLYFSRELFLGSEWCPYYTTL